MKPIIIIFLFLCSFQMIVGKSANAQTMFDGVFNQAVNSLIKNYCPYNGLFDQNKYCGALANTNKIWNQHLHTYFGVKKNANDISKFPSILGTGWDPILGEIMLPFLELSYDQNKQIKTTSGVFLIPDQIDVKIINKTDIVSQKYQNADDYFNLVDPNRNTVRSGTLSLPIDQMSNIVKFFDNGDNNIVDVVEYNFIYNLTFITKPNISQQMSKLLKSLPKNYTDDYLLFLEYWGTHVVISGLAGGLANQLVMSKDCFGGADASDQSILMMMKNLYPYTYQNVDYKANFQQYSKGTMIDMFGGNPSVLNWTERVKTFNNNPVLIDLQVLPVTDFIDDPIIKNNMMKAINEYFTSGIAQMNQFRKDYYTNFGNSKLVSFVPLINTNGGYYLFSNCADSINLKTGESKTYTSSNMWYEIFCPQIVCQRDTKGLLYSYSVAKNVTLNGNKWFPANIKNGNGVKSGCSQTVYDYDIKDVDGVTNINMYGDRIGLCCMSCIPSYVYNAGNPYYQGCTCPTMT